MSYPGTPSCQGSSERMPDSACNANATGKCNEPRRHLEKKKECSGVRWVSQPHPLPLLLLLLLRLLSCLQLCRILGPDANLFGNHVLYSLDKDGKGIVTIVGLRTRHKQKLLLFQTFGSCAILDPAFLELTQM